MIPEQRRLTESQLETLLDRMSNDSRAATAAEALKTLNQNCAPAAREALRVIEQEVLDAIRLRNIRATAVRMTLGLDLDTLGAHRVLLALKGEFDSLREVGDW